ncbi:MAG: hypothetical protein AB8B83_03310 [Bdellovibrionales bacterium]
MSQGLPSTFLEIMKDAQNEAVDIVSNIHDDLKMSFGLVAGLKWHGFSERFPEIASKTEDLHAKAVFQLCRQYTAIAMRSEVSNPALKVPIAFGLIGVGVVNPLPGDISLGVLLLTSTFRQSKGFAREVIDEMDGTLEKRQFQDAIDSIAATYDTEKHIVIECCPQSLS